jgi:hypothetical protein
MLERGDRELIPVFASRQLEQGETLQTQKHGTLRLVGTASPGTLGMTGCLADHKA